jgi:hypothetical protein
MTTFVLFLVAFVVAILLMARHMNRRQHAVEGETERVAQDALPAIGKIAERAHSHRFGRPPTNLPAAAGDRSRQTSWYPESKKVAKRHA